MCMRNIGWKLFCISAFYFGVHLLQSLQGCQLLNPHLHQVYHSTFACYHLILFNNSTTLLEDPHLQFWDHFLVNLLQYILTLPDPLLFFSFSLLLHPLFHLRLDLLKFLRCNIGSGGFIKSNPVSLAITIDCSGSITSLFQLRNDSPKMTSNWRFGQTTKTWVFEIYWVHRDAITSFT